MSNFKHRDDCRLCGSRHLDLVLPIKPSAIGDAFIPASLLDEKQDVYPLTTYLCLDCGHLQNLDMVDPDILFRQYTYKTSSSLGLVDHFHKYADYVVSSIGLKPESFVVEIGSNDGSLLKAYQKHGMNVLGVDPARAIAAEATASGVQTIPEFFCEELAGSIVESHGKADLVCANNVFAHIDNIAGIVKGIRNILTDDGVFVFEVSYVPDIIDNFVFDTIYHEHVSHHALNPLEAFFNKLDMTLFDVVRVKSKGGSIRGFAQPLSTGKRDKSPLLLAMMEEEKQRGIMQPAIYHEFYRAIEERKQIVLDYLDQAIASGKTIAAYGASTTTTTLLYHFELGERVSFMVDDNPIKQGLFSPGYHIPVLSSSELMTRKPDIVVVLSWTYADIIASRNKAYLDLGGEFVIPLPNVKRINATGTHELSFVVKKTGT